MLIMLLDRLGASLLANMLGKEVVRDGGGVIWTGERTNRAGQDF